MWEGLSNLTAVETAEGVRQGRFTAVDRTRAALEAIRRNNGPINAFIRVDEDGAIRQASAVDAARRRGEDPGPLAGTPIGVKDMEACAGFPVTQGSWFLRDSPPETKDSRHVARLRAAGAVMIGMTASAEFGMDSATNTRLYGVTRNPWNLRTTPGGSSGGSAAAVAAGLTPLATGTDAGGSIREPAAFTGLVGLKPSHGRIPKANGFAQWSVHGALARTAADAARHLDVACGPDDGDRQSLPAPGLRYETAIETLNVAGLRAVWSPDYGYAPVEPEVMEIAHDAFQRLVALADLRACEAAFTPVNIYPHWGAIFGSTLEEDFIRDGILPDGFDQLSDCVQRVLTRVRQRRGQFDVKASWAEVYRLEQQVAAFFQDFDLLLSPATACAPYAADGPIPAVINGRDASMSGAEPFGMLANACWNPSISIPAGLTGDGLPVGLQIVAKRHRDEHLLRLARILEADRPPTFPAPPFG